MALALALALVLPVSPLIGRKFANCLQKQKRKRWSEFDCDRRRKERAIAG